jgi:hypothetical protein
VRSLVDRVRPAVRRLREPVRKLLPLGDQLDPVSAELRDAVVALRPQMPALDYVTKSVAGCSAALQGFFQWTPSVTKFHDAHGPSLRGDFALGVDDTTVAPDPNVRALPSCAPGRPVGGTPSPGRDLTSGGGGQ